MNQQRIIRDYEHVPGGYMVAIEVTNAYTNGESRFDRVFVAAADLADQDDDGVMAAVCRALDSPPIARVRGLDTDAYRELQRVTDTPIAALREFTRGIGGKP